MNRGLLIETHLFEAKLVEQDNGTYLVKGILQRAGAPNQNNRRYPKERSINSIEPNYLCNECGKRLQRHYGSFGIKFNGSGFYKTDNPK